MARFRLLVIISAVWITFLFNIERLNIGALSIDLDSVTYVVAAVAALATLWLPDVARHTGTIFIPALALFISVKLLTGSPLNESALAIVGIEVVVIYLTVSLFRRVSMALLSFEHTVDSVLLRQDTLRVLPMEEGIERVQQEISRARRFERKLGLILISTRLTEDDRKSADAEFRFDLEEALQKHYIQLRLAQIAELVLYKVDLIMLHKDDVLVCMPETTEEMVRSRAAELVEEISWRLGRRTLYGVSMFPDDGFIYRDLVDKATVRLYEAHDNYLTEQQDSDDDDPRAPHANEREDETIAAGAGAPNQPSNGIAMAVREIFEPWPDIILQNQRRENFGARALDPGERHTLLDPNSWLGALPYQSVASRRLYTVLKQALDIVLVVVSLPLTIPLMLIVASLVWLEDRGPVFFVQERTGLGGRRFSMYKFRTMVPNAEEKLRDMAIQGLVRLDEDGKLVEPLKLVSDPRVTTVGAFLRQTSLDELPQILNVLKGEMSLVGPRPTSWSTDNYRLFHTERLQVRPGITGLWQVVARGNTNFNEWVDWDRTYVDKMCLSLDVQILLRTFAVLVQQKGAR